jgi:ATP-dependent RNA helicase DeaD
VPGERVRHPDGDGGVVRVFVGAGRRGGIRPGDLVGAITGESGLESRDIGAIEINDNFSLVEVPQDRAEEVIAALRATKLRGLRVTVRLER